MRTLTLAGPAEADAPGHVAWPPTTAAKGPAGPVGAGGAGEGLPSVTTDGRDQSCSTINAVRGDDAGRGRR